MGLAVILIYALVVAIFLMGLDHYYTLPVWEVFDHRTGETLHVTRSETRARWLAGRGKWLDYAREGEGW